MHVFEDKGFSFDTGLHYVGKASKYGKLLDMVSLPCLPLLACAGCGTGNDT